MKTPRLFILLGACALLFTFIASAAPLFVRASGASEIPIVRYDPRAGDPEEPGYWKSIPYDEDGSFQRIDVTVELTTRPSESPLRPAGANRWWRAAPFRAFGLLFWLGR